MNPELEEVIKKFLRYSYNPINYSYDELTPTEKTFATREEYEQLVRWLKEGK